MAAILKVEGYDGNNYTLLINPIGWQLADYQNFATSYAVANNATVTIYKALEDHNPDGTVMTYS